MDFEGKKVLITGGASGIGKIMARKSLERKCSHLILLDINEEGLKSVALEFSHFNIPVHTYTIDLSSLEQIKEISNQIKSTFGGVDILINNAGIVFGKYFYEHTHSEIAKSLLINSNAVMHLTLEFLPLMMENNAGAICNIASSAGLISNPKMSVYAASKWAVVGWSDSLRLEMETLKKDISVTTFMPYYINTGMFDGVKSKLLPILKPEPTAEKIMNAIERKTKMLATPLPYWFIRLSQGIMPLPVFDWVMKNVFGIYDTMTDFKGRG